LGNVPAKDLRKVLQVPPALELEKEKANQAYGMIEVRRWRWLVVVKLVWGCRL
jgi:hypothetical protein